MRESGILMPVSSLPGPYGIGCFGKEAFKFVDFLADAGQKIWQLLPLSPTGYGDSPYQSCSAFAGNPYFIDLDALKEEGLLTAAQLKAEPWGDDPKQVDYGTLYTSRYKVLRTAYAAWRKACKGLHGCSDYFPDDYYAFTLSNEAWLEDYALYMALKVANGMKNWVEWERPYRLRDKAALAALLHDSAKEISKDEMRELMRQYPQYAEGGEERPASVWHGICAAILARTRWGVEDEAILSAIACHTAGRAGMSKLDKVVYLADMTSKERDWPGVGKLRKLEMKDLDAAMLAALKQTNDFVLSQGKPLDPQSAAAYEDILAHQKKEC